MHSHDFKIEKQRGYYNDLSLNKIETRMTTFIKEKKSIGKNKDDYIMIDLFVNKTLYSVQLKNSHNTNDKIFLILITQTFCYSFGYAVNIQLF